MMLPPLPPNFQLCDKKLIFLKIYIYISKDVFLIANDHNFIICDRHI